MNKVILKGNLGQDPDVRTFEWGKVCKFTLATSESYTNKQGEKVTETEWHNVVFRGQIVDVIEKYVHKGTQLLVEGKIKTRSYDDKNGVTKFVTEVICHTFEFCGTKERVESKPDNNEGKYQGKQPVKAMSDVSELPGYVNDGDVPDDFPI